MAVRGLDGGGGAPLREAGRGSRKRHSLHSGEGEGTWASGRPYPVEGRLVPSESRGNWPERAWPGEENEAWGTHQVPVPVY